MPKTLLTTCNYELSDVEVRVSDDGKSTTLVGYAAKFEALSVPIYNSYREKIRSGAFANSLKNNGNIFALWNHNRDSLLGSTISKTLRLSEDNKGLRFELDLPDTQAGKDAGVLVKRKDVSGMSFGFIAKQEEWDERDAKNIVRTLIEVDLREVSITPYPAYMSTSVKVRSVSDDYDEYRAFKAKENVTANENETLTMLRKVEAL